MRTILYCGLIAILASCSIQPPTAADPLDYIPQKTLLVFKTDDVSAINTEFAHTPELTAFFSPVLHRSTHWDSFEKATVSLHDEGKQDYKYLLIHTLDTQDSIPALLGDTLRYENRMLVRFTEEEQSRYATVWNRMYFESDSKIVLENSIRLQKKPGLPNAQLRKLYHTSTQGTRIFIHQSASDFLSTRFKGKIPFDINDFTNWTALDLDSGKVPFKINATGLLDSNKMSKMDLLLDQESDFVPLLASSPLNAIGVQAYAFDYNNFTQKSRLYNAQENLSYTTPDSLLTEANSVAKVHLRSGTIAVVSYDAIEGLESKLRLQSVETKKIRDVMQYRFEASHIKTSFLPSLLDLPSLEYAALFDGQLILAPSAQLMEEVLTQLAGGYTLGSDDSFATLTDQIPSRASFLLLGVEPAFSQSLKNSLVEDIPINEAPEQPYWLGIGNVTSGVAQLQLQQIDKQKTTSTSRPKLVFSKQLKAPMATHPQGVVNHNDGSMEWVVQDAQNRLYQISTNGTVLWEKDVKGAIQFPITQVDLYKNKRLQLAYTTDSKFEVLDRNGNTVRPFSKSLKNPLPLAVFDYDKNRDYRLVLVAQKQLELRNRSFKKVSGFKRTNVDPIYPPQHFRIGSRDYVAMVEKSGSLLLLDRRGNIRIKTPSDLQLSTDVSVHQNGFVGVDKKNRLFRIETSGKISYRTLPFETSYKIAAQGKNLVLLSENNLEINGRSIEMDFGVYTQPQIHVVNNRAFISLTDLQSNKCYLFDRDGELLPHFPLFGSGQADVIADRKGQVYISVRGEEDQLLVYQLSQ